MRMEKPMGQVITMTAVARRESPWFSWQWPCGPLATRWIPVRPFSMWNFFCYSECSSLARKICIQVGDGEASGTQCEPEQHRDPPHVPASTKTGRKAFQAGNQMFWLGWDAFVASENIQGRDREFLCPRDSGRKQEKRAEEWAARGGRLFWSHIVMGLKSWVP